MSKIIHNDFILTNSHIIDNIYKNNSQNVKDFINDIKKSNLNFYFSFYDEYISIRNTKFTPQQTKMQNLSKLIILSEKHNLNIEYKDCDFCDVNNKNCPKNECIIIK